VQTIKLWARLSHRMMYGWASEDLWCAAGKLKVTPPQQTNSGWIRYARIQSKADFQLLSKAIADTMGGTKCRHLHDCCGCSSTSIQVTRIRPRLVQIRGYVTFNN